MKPLHERPLAAHGFISYRYPSRHGWIMIGAKDNDDAIREANRSLTVPNAAVEKMQVWDGSNYVPAQTA